MSIEMKILHTGDVHLGFSAYGSVDDDGINRRQADIFGSFGSLVDRAISERVDCVLICGDLFNNLKNSNLTIGFCMDRLSRLNRNGIATCIISGNHDTPKTSGAASPLVIPEFMDNIICAYDDYRYHNVGELGIHMIPYTADRERFEEMTETARFNTRSDRFDILMLHAAVDTFRMLQYDEIVLTKTEIADLKRSFDYVALGHYHGKWIDDNVAYCGSLESLTFNEKDDEKGFIIIDDGKPTFVKNENARRMTELPGIELSDTDDPTGDILGNIAGSDIDGCICRMRITNVPALVYRALDFRRLKLSVKDALFFDFIFDICEEVLDFNTTQASFKSVSEEWSDFTNAQNVDAEIIALGSDYIEKFDA
jgi:DNA repair exonuclease SbcCD nuclease subunit